MRPNTTVQLLEPGSVAGIGGIPEISWTVDPTVHPPVPASLEPVDSTDDAVGTSTTVSRWLLRLRLDTEVHWTWRVRHEGTDYSIDGDVAKWSSRNRGYLEMTLRKVDRRA